MTKDIIRLEHVDPNQRRVMFVDWSLGNTCNYECTYCPDRLHNGSVAWSDRSAIINFCGKLLDHYQRLGKSVYFQFTGGEPTLYPGFLELISNLKSQACEIAVISNGSRRLAWWELARESLDAALLTHHIEFAKFDHFLSVVRLLSETIRTHVNVTMHPERFDECLDRALQLAESCTDISVTLKPLLVGFGSLLYPYTEAQREILQKTILQPKKTRPRKAVRRVMLKIHRDGTSRASHGSHLIVDHENQWFGWSCHIGLELLSINSRGEVYRAGCRQGGLVGHISDELISFPVQPVICRQDICHSITDIMTTKVEDPEAWENGNQRCDIVATG